ncbi:hypothetical protein Avbf_12073 [Armadillidium vulgare]|nr:hypothetical protein Avbf_12073 [Armadillidium vulgare]
MISYTKCAKIIHPYIVDNCCLFKGTSVRLNSDSPNIPLRRITSTLCEVSVVGTYLHLSEFFCCEGLFVNLFVYLNSYSGSSSNNS